MCRRVNMKAITKPTVTVSARIIRKDGTIENLGVIAKTDKRKVKKHG
jgi:hypothetical protein